MAVRIYEHPPLTMDKLEELERELRGGVEGRDRIVERLLGLGALVGHLDDRWVIGGEQVITEGVPLLLSAFEHPAGPWMYAAVDHLGQLTVGLARDLGKKAQITLDGLDFERDEVRCFLCFLNLPSGEYVDLWLVILRHVGAAESWMTFSARVGWEPGGATGGRVWLRQNTEGGAGDTSRAVLQVATNLRPWVKETVLSPGTGANLFDPQAAEVTRGPVEAGALRRAVWSPGVVAGIDARDDVIWWRVGEQTLRRLGWEGARGVALYPSERGTLLIAGREDGTFSVVLVPAQRGADPVELGRHRLNGGVADFCALPSEVAGDEQPELLMLLRDGRLQRLRALDEGRVRQVWLRAWAELNSAPSWSPGATILQIRELDQERERHDVRELRAARQALLVHLVERLVSDVETVAPDRIDLVAGCFAGEVADTVLVPAVLLLLRVLADSAGRDSPGARVVLALLKQIYERAGSVVLTERINVEVLRLHHGAALCPALRQAPDCRWLFARSRRNRADWLEIQATNDDERWLQRAIALERHASLLEISDAYPLGSEDGGPRGVIGAARAEGKTVLLTSSGGETEAIQVFPGSGKASAGGAPGVGPFTAMCPLASEEGQALLVAGPGGHVSRLALSQGGVGFREVELGWMVGTDLDGWTVGALAVLSAGARTLVAVGARRRRQSRVHVFELSREVSREPITVEQHLVQCLALAQGADGCAWLISGGLLEHSARLHRLGDAGDSSGGPARQLPAAAPVRAICAGGEELNIVLIGDRAGFLWCYSIAGPVPRLLWTHLMVGSVRCVLAIALEGASCFLAGAEGGSLVLLRADDGRRLWKHGFSYPIRHLCAWREGPMIRVGALMAEGVLYILSSNPDAARADAETKAIARLPASMTPPNGVAVVLSLIHHAPDESLDAFIDVVSRSDRAHLLHLFAERGRSWPAPLRDKLLAMLSYWDLSVLLCYLTLDADWVHRIQGRLGAMEPSGEKGEWSVAAAAAATVCWIQRRPWEVSGEQGLSYLTVPPALYGNRWVQIELARVLLAGVVEVGAPDQIADRLIQQLNLHDPRLLEGLRYVASNFPELVSPIAALRAVVQGLTRAGTPPSQEHWLTLSAWLKGRPGRAVALVRGLVEFAGRVEAVGTSRATWSNSRSGIIEALRELMEVLTEPQLPHTPLYLLREGLHRMLGEVAPPKDQAPFQERMEWLVTRRGALQRLRLEKVEPILQRSPAWSGPLGFLMRALRKLITTLLAEERGWLDERTRLFPRPVSCVRSAGDRIVLDLELIAEGGARLENVNVIVRASGAGGLAGGPDERLEAQLALHPVVPGQTRWLVRLEGFARHNQRDVRVQILLSASGGFEDDQSWKIPLPDSYRIAATPFPRGLPLAVAALAEMIRDDTSLIQVLVVDTALGPDALADELCVNLGLVPLPLDQKMARVSARITAMELSRWASDLIRGTASSVPEATKGARARLLLHPVMSLFERLMRGDPDQVPRALDHLLTTLREQAPRAVVVVAPGHVAAISAQLPARAFACWTASHLHLTAREPDRVRQEIHSWLQTSAVIDAQQAASVFRALGEDLTLCSYWVGRRWEEANAGPPEVAARVVEGVLRDPQAREHLLNRIALLSPLASVLCLIASMARSRLPSARAGAPPAEVDGYATQDDATTARLPRLGQLVEALTDAERRLYAAVEAVDEGMGTLERGVFLPFLPLRLLALEHADVVGREVGDPTDPPPLAWLQRWTQGRTDLIALVPLERWQGISDDLLALAAPSLVGAERRTFRLLSQAWGGAPVVAEVLALIYKAPATRLQELAGDRHEDLAGLALLGLHVFGLGAVPRAGGLYSRYVAWLERGVRAGLPQLRRAWDGCVGGVLNEGGEAVRLEVLGPGASSWSTDPDRRFAVLGAGDVSWAATRGDISRGLERRARSQLPLRVLSPFRARAALEPGSPLFKGRVRELMYIQEHVRRQSLLIIGPRRIGKSSLLYQVLHWAKDQRDLEPIFVDCAGITQPQEFAVALARSASVTAKQSVGLVADAVVAGAQKRSRLPVFLLNEIDGLLSAAPYVLEKLRRLNDASTARFVLVGYASAAASVHDPRSPLYHFTTGPGTGGALHLSALEPEAAEAIVHLLEGPPLHLIWRTEAERREGVSAVLSRTYRIPWAIQALCNTLVEHLDGQRRDELRAEDVYEVLGLQSELIWTTLSGIDVKALSPALGERAQEGVMLIMTCLARERYFLGGDSAPIRQPGLALRDPLDLAFTVAEARAAMIRTIGVVLREDERERVTAWLNRQDLEKVLRDLTLTLLVAQDPLDAQRFAFPLHLWPLELQRRRGAADPTLDGAILDAAVRFMQ